MALFQSHRLYLKINIMRLISFLIVVLFSSCTKNTPVEYDIYFHRQQNDKSKWEFISRESTSKPLDLKIEECEELKNFTANHLQLKKYHCQGDGDDQEEILIVSNKNKLIMAWNLEGVALYNPKKNHKIHQRIIKDSTIFNFDYVPLPPRNDLEPKYK